jgi:hypothetical protein
MLPEMYTVWPKLVVRRSLNVTRVLVGVELHWPGVVGVDVRPGQAVLVAVAQGPVAEPREQTEGALACKVVSRGWTRGNTIVKRHTEAAPHEAGMACARALLAVRKAA